MVRAPLKVDIYNGESDDDRLNGMQINRIVCKLQVETARCRKALQSLAGLSYLNRCSHFLHSKPFQQGAAHVLCSITIAS